MLLKMTCMTLLASLAMGCLSQTDTVEHVEESSGVYDVVCYPCDPIVCVDVTDDFEGCDAGSSSDASSSSTGEACNVGVYAETGSVDELPTDCVFELHGVTYPCQTPEHLWCGPYAGLPVDLEGWPDRKEVEACIAAKLEASIDACIVATDLCDDWRADDVPRIRCRYDSACRDCVDQLFGRHVSL